MSRHILPRLLIDQSEHIKAYLLLSDQPRVWYVMKICGPSFFLSCKVSYLPMVGLFVFCQVIGLMCSVPDVSLAGENPVLSENAMACPMDGTIMCPPSLTSSPERQIKQTLVADIDYATILLSPTAILTVPSVSTLWSWSNAYSTAPVSIGSSSVLRI